ncbi:unnamed protein product [Phaedon cochleariae]|uniref:J domain-containing protein n=1 Tax=Phaedon cochleariae TaxID=80249 RepID=A0A9N9WXR4_PHACE|nr:unnamed protein product [Phaedon cochleariae]
MADFNSLCEKYFGCCDFYEILKVDRNASEKEIKKAYYRLSLLFHPDRVDDDHKEIATEKFKALGKIHSILQNPDKRNLYNESGQFDDEMDTSFNCMDYWRNMFKKIEIKDIQKYEREYIGSDTELRDIKRAYVGGKGNMDVILEMVPFSNCDSEPRIIDIVQKMVDNEEVEYYKTFFNESKAKKMRRHRKYEKEKKLSEQIDMEELDKQIEANMQKRVAEFDTFISDLEARYAPKTKKKRLSITDTKKKNKKSK